LGEVPIVIDSRRERGASRRGSAGWLVFFAVTVVACDRTTLEQQQPNVAPGVSSAAAPAPCPDEMAFVALARGAICVDKYEASIVGRRYSESLDGIDASTLRARPAKGIKPQVNISEHQAEAACEAASKRLCTETEWTTACRGEHNLVYPYGNEHVAGACNDGRPRPDATALSASGGRLDDPRLAEAENGIEPGGAFPRCVSSVGAFDMHGNVHEWVSDSSKADDPRYGMFLGGFFADASENGAGCAYKTSAHFKDYHDYSIGFRCCKEAGP
jgi:formylglycine-generating enzyme